MKKRLFSTVLIWCLVGAALFFGRTWGGLALLIVVSGAAHWECCRILRKCGGAPRTPLAVAAGVLLLAAAGAGLLVEDLSWVDVRSLSGWEGVWRVALPGLIPGVVALGFLLFRPAKLPELFTTWPTAFSWLYIPCSLLPLVVLSAEFARNPPPGGPHTGLLLVLWLVAVVKFSDCGALLSGLSFGERRHRMAPAISPGKSWEGCVGGVLFAVLVAAGVAWLYGRFQAELGFSPAVAARFTPARAALLGLPLGILAIPSDLVESALKRRAGVKDSGATIPGIGGAFDLLDSLVLTSPVAYLLLKFAVL
ncbi:MAG: phosphatidate cytidylyltransferase [Puniceicoccales bacterium]|jgi:phosphatidate cytidylyltransferase|nr:phosphatidate cytidylyltransferase [Puniceicoccales bacterium]